MAGITHLGVGFVAKAVTPKVPLWVLIVGAYLIDIVWGVFYALKIETYADSGLPSPWSHGLIMSLVWSLLAGLLAYLILKNKKTGLFIGLLVFSHWIIDFIAKPMRYSFPNEAGLAVFFGNHPQIGLGLWSTQLGQNIGEYVPLAVGIMIYIFITVKLRKLKSAKGESA